ncbi:hypothetical protein MBM_09418 [Drepanopeziza brunnea f. sp. 'multigermtubi' MB_m1]|uniref:Uncharacterized protein n=1 Tax=Marssonina brunnea f. sp. multigermtubi (strain MB_m1) TaxID=1072389 RepID=K1XIS8_MARBU|nr:uncharacterized protein MBM_09418 [Drepanopeziza brunnea f. sp. 'multigermtubi' MB_m1]EKD12384.1 hypothetical protein MBM_09418 [Drepanopeziza brunnea f. sp. 'multigermtubi' MB_m1]
MRFINVLFAATIIAIAHAEEPMPEWEDPDRNRKVPVEDASGRMGILLVCEDPWWKNCENVTYFQDKCMGLGPYNLDNKMTGFDTYSYGCEFYGPGLSTTVMIMREAQPPPFPLTSGDRGSEISLGSTASCSMPADDDSLIRAPSSKKQKPRAAAGSSKTTSQRKKGRK